MSRFQPAYPALNGPLAGDHIDAPFAMQPGNAVALPWLGPKGRFFAVYVVTNYTSPTGPALGLMYVKSWTTPETAQAHVQTLGTVAATARHVAATQGEVHRTRIISPAAAAHECVNGDSVEETPT